MKLNYDDKRLIESTINDLERKIRKIQFKIFNNKQVKKNKNELVKLYNKLKLYKDLLNKNE